MRWKFFWARGISERQKGTAFAVPCDSQLASALLVLTSAAKAAQVRSRFGTAKAVPFPITTETNRSRLTPLIASASIRIANSLHENRRAYRSLRLVWRGRPRPRIFQINTMADEGVRPTQNTSYSRLCCRNSCTYSNCRFGP